MKTKSFDEFTSRREHSFLLFNFTTFSILRRQLNGPENGEKLSIEFQHETFVLMCEGMKKGSNDVL